MLHLRVPQLIISRCLRQKATLAKTYKNYIKQQRSLGPTTSIALSKNDIKALKGIKRFGALPLEEVIASKDEGSKQSEVLIEDDQTTKNPTILKAFQKSNSCLDSPNQDDSILHQPSVKEGFRKPPKVTIVALPTAKDLVFINDVPEVNPITCPLSQDESTQPLLSPGSSASNKTAKVWPRISDPRTNISANLPHHEAPISGLSTLQSEDCFSTIKSPASAIDQSHDKAFQGPNSGVENLDTISKAAKITHSTDGSLSNLVRRREPKYTRFDLSGLDVGRLKYLLKKAGINYQADSRHSTLSKLYKLFLAKQHSKNSDSNKHPRIELPQSLNPSNLSQQSIPVPLSCPVASSSMIPPSEIQTFDEFNQPISNIQGISENTQSFSPLLSTMRDLEEFNWPRPSLLSVDEIKTYLKNNNVEFNDDDNFETLAKCYRSMVVTLQSCYPFKKRCLNWNSAKQPRYCQTCSKLKRLGRKSNNDFNFCATPNESLLNKVCSTPYQSASTSITLVPSPQQPLNKTICADAQQQLGMQALNSINMPFDQPSTAKSSLESYSCITSERILSKNDVLDSEKEEDILATRICSSKGKAHKYPVIYETETEIDDECPSRESTRMFIPSQSASSNTKPLISGSKKGKLTENQLMSNNISELKSSKFQFSRQEYQSDDEQLVNIKNNSEKALSETVTTENNGHEDDQIDSNGCVQDKISDDNNECNSSSGTEFQPNDDTQVNTDLNKEIHHSVEDVKSNDNELNLNCASLQQSQPNLEQNELESITQENNQSRGFERFDDFPPSSCLTVAQMKTCLDKHSVRYKSRDRKSQIVELYDAMRAQKLSRSSQKGPNIECVSETRSTKLIEKTILSRPQSSFKAPENLDTEVSISQPAPPNSPKLLFSENVLNVKSNQQYSPMQISTDQDPDISIHSAMESITYKNKNLVSPLKDSVLDQWRKAVPHSLIIDSHDDCTSSAEILRSFEFHAGKSTAIVGQILDKMNDMVETLEDLSISFSGFNINKDGKHRLGPSRTNHMPQHGWFPRLIWQRIATLLGLKDGGLPNPHDENNQLQMDVDDEEHDSDWDPCYPYPRGPGHTNATPQTLSIMWRMMNEAGIKSFQPDFSQPFNSPDNNCLFDLSVKIFFELVDCGEYTGVDSDNLNRESVRSAIDLHVTQRLRRRFWEENNWSNNKIAQQEKILCCNSSRFDNLLGLIPIVRECCSDDESDKEVVQPIQSSYSKQKPKECVACKLPWRHPRVTRLMVALDKIKLKESESSSRVEFPPISQLQPPSPIHKCCFDDHWLSSQPQYRIDALKLHSKTDVKEMIHRLESELLIS
ncbi:expressed protein [Phakopsora pachyrhizi]|uniref:Expressed protein n=1 Tax=Phakopsora pachyrhizi TaxID=170000 RepID=A0AAV0BEI7_PHAPC|nr:expressed protein [Phakopsora pachyrhizi]